MKIYLKTYAILLVSAFYITNCFAQTPEKKPVVTKVTKFKPPVVKPYLGVNTTDATVTAAEADQLIALPLKITDTQNNTYTIDSYHFLYKRKGVVEDEQTGRKQVSFTTVSDMFRTTPLSKVWIDNIQGGFQPGEELHFFDIVVKDKSGRKFFAPDLKITIK